MKTILFQGDSITDAGRNFSNPQDLGPGYAGLIGAELDCTYPQQYTVLNRGIGGNRVVDLYARWKADCLNLKPDILTILIGVNDVWHELSYQNGVEADRYEKFYRMLLDETKAALPDVKIILMEPYLVKGTATEENWGYFSSEVAIRRDAVRRIAKDYQLELVPLQEIFDEACKNTPASWWTADGVHPTRAGHALIARNWMQYFGRL